MTLLTTLQDAQLAQDVVTLSLQGALNRHGSQKTFAASAGISKVHVNYIINKKRMPSRKMAEWMAPFLPMPPAEREMWVNFVHAYWKARGAFRHELMPGIDLQHFAAQVQQARQKAGGTSDPATARINNEIAHKLSSYALAHAAPEWNPLLYLQLMESFLVASASLSRLLDALWMARRMQWVASSIEPLARYESLAQLHKFRLTGMRYEALMSISIGLRAHAYALIQKNIADPIFNECPEIWELWMLRDKLDAIALMPRSSLSEARQIWRAGMNLIDSGVIDQPEVDHLLLTRSFTEAILSHGRFSESRKLIELLEGQTSTHTNVGYRVLFDCTLAKVLWHQPARDVQRWQAVVKRNHAAASQAGYTNIVWEMQQDYGDALLEALAA